MSASPVVVEINGVNREIIEVCGTIINPAEGPYPEERLYIVQTKDAGSYLVPERAFSIDPSTLPISGQTMVWR